MFCLVTLSISAGNLGGQYLEVKTTPNSLIAPVDIRYKYLGANRNIKYGTTRQNMGWSPMVELDRKERFYVSGANGGNMTYKDTVKITTEYGFPFERTQNHLLLKFTITNIDPEEPHRISFSLSSTVSIDGQLKSKISWYGGKGNEKRGMLWEQDNNIYPKLYVIAKNCYGVDDVDDFWFGPTNSNHNHHFEYARNDTSPSKFEENSFSLTWRDRIFEPNTSLTVGVMVCVGLEDLHINPAYITFDPDIPTNYDLNSSIAISGNVTEVDDESEVSFFYKLYTDRDLENNLPVQAHLYPSGTTKGKVNYHFNIELGNLPDYVTRYKAELWCTDNSTYNNVQYHLISNMATHYYHVNHVPLLKYVQNIPTIFYTGGYIEFAGEVWDDRSLRVRYQYDEDGLPRNITREWIQTNRVAKYVRRSFKIRSDLINYGKHTLYLWAEDDYGFRSDYIKHDFYYYEQLAPEIKFTDYDETVKLFDPEKMKEFEIGVSVFDKDSEQTIIIYQRSPEDSISQSARPVYSLNSGPEWQNVTLNYEIPKGVLQYNTSYSIIFKASDSLTATSREIEYKFKLFSESDPNKNGTYGEKPQIGKKDETKDNLMAIDSTAPKKKVDWKWIIIGVAIGLIVLVILISIIVLACEANKKANEFYFDEENEKFVTIDGNMGFTNENPIYDPGKDNDPFANEFDENQAANDNVFEPPPQP
ncbi:hypothetical protein TVAG_494220 [Trichomonas vaginalis G3]|uniref:Uncharacterized protein n=1 Tax=Trichomonas vaginalis (strain ATCC PRA-98 / G3) TaxID=412133 RepID=A2DQ53_TRIV3|nr:ribonuclease H protein family [Trichomonas vaginalis G3]EAY17480.1 hypothetical protein TVAG_494220 [Trichomonas vaginalis G3]KAI5533585.1 ribonuclease H protein family [Trichomonas vaginalis G3]|eukprot:XP_001329615.1 hypothetical protein [Trichomonas vaginalis G3]